MASESIEGQVQVLGLVMKMQVLGLVMEVQVLGIVILVGLCPGKGFMHQLQDIGGQHIPQQYLWWANLVGFFLFF